MLVRPCPPLRWINDPLAVSMRLDGKETAYSPAPARTNHRRPLASFRTCFRSRGCPGGKESHADIDP